MAAPNTPNRSQLKMEHATLQSAKIRLPLHEGATMPTEVSMMAQFGLKDLGLYKGKLPENWQSPRIYDHETKAAVQQFQKIVGLPATGTLDQKTFDVMSLAVNAAAPRTVPAHGKHDAAATLQKAELKKIEAILGHKIELSKFPGVQKPASAAPASHKKTSIAAPSA